MGSGSNTKDVHGSPQGIEIIDVIGDKAEVVQRGIQEGAIGQSSMVLNKDSTFLQAGIKRKGTSKLLPIPKKKGYGLYQLSKQCILELYQEEPSKCVKHNYAIPSYLS